MDAISRLEAVDLPPRDCGGTLTVAQAIAERRSVRSFSNRPIPLNAVSALLWAAQGITSDGGLRTAPSAGALHPLALYLVAGRIADLAPGVWRYLPERHALRPGRSGDYRAAVANAALRQQWMRDCAGILVLAAACEPVVRKYGSRGRHYAFLEAGCAAENAWLQARALSLDAAMVGTFVDTELGVLIGLPADEFPVLLLAVGHGAAEVPAGPASDRV